MTAQMMIQPSSLLPDGIEIEQVNNFNLFKFTDDLQARFDELLECNKTRLLTSEEAAELAGISDLSRLFTLINAMLVAQGWLLIKQLRIFFRNQIVKTTRFQKNSCKFKLLYRMMSPIP